MLIIPRERSISTRLASFLSMIMSLYEVTNVASFEIEEGHPKVFASSGTICVTYSSNVHLIKEDDGMSQALLEFDNPLMAAGISEDGCLLVVGDRSGLLHFVCPANNLAFYSQKLLNDGDQFVTMEFSKIDKGCCKLYVLSSTGILYVFKNILITKLNDALISGDAGGVQQVQNSIHLQVSDLSIYHKQQITSITTDSDILISCGHGDRGLCVWEETDDDEERRYYISDDVALLLKGTIVTHCGITGDGCLLVALTDTLAVTVWLVEMMVMINLMTRQRVQDFVLSPSPQIGTQDLCCCLSTTNDQEVLKIFSLPHLNILYSLSVHSPILCRGWPSEDILYFAEVASDETTPTCLTLKTLVQTRPEEKLFKLLSQEKFSEAFELAAKYGLDKQVVLRKKAQLLNKQLCGGGDNDFVLSCQLKLIDALNEVKDELFLSNLILQSIYPSLSCTNSLLLYTKKRLTCSKSENAYSLREKVYLTLNKLVTYQLITGSKQYSPSSWRGFMEGSLVSEFVRCTQSGELNSASCIWSRHQTHLISQFNGDQMLNLLQTIPESVLSTDMGLWLKADILPYFICHFPNQLDLFTSWLIERTCRLELMEKSSWPTNALQLLDIVIRSITSNKKWEEHLGIQADNVTSISTLIQSSSMNMLRELQCQLQNLKFVKTQLDMTLTLSDFKQETHESILFKLLDKAIAPEVLPSLLQNQIQPYLDHHSLSMDTVLLHYIKYMLTRFPTLAPDSPWEAKAITIVRSIQDNKVQIEGCIELLQGVQRTQGVLPNWSTAVEGLVQECLQMDYPCVQDLHKQHKLLQLRCMLFEYGIRDFNFSYSDTSRAWKYIRYVLKQQGERVLQDALQIAELYMLDQRRVYIFYIINLGSNGKSWQIGDVLRVLPIESAISVAMTTSSFMLTKLEDLGQDYNNMSKELREELFSPEEWKTSIDTAVECFKFLLLAGTLVTAEGDSIKEIISILKRMKSLQVDFNEVNPITDMRNTKICLTHVKDRLTSLLPPVTGLDDSTTTTSMTDINNYMRYGQLLGVAEVELYLQLVLGCLRRGDTKEAIRFSGFLSSIVDKSVNDPSVVNALVAIVMGVWLQFEEKDQLVSPLGQVEVQWMVKLASTTVEICQEDDILHCLELHRLCSYLKWVWSQCNSGCVTVNQTLSQFELGNFKEDGLILEPGEVLPLAVGYCYSYLTHLTNGGVLDMRRSSLYVNRVERNMSSSFIESVLKLVTHFHDNSHCELGLKTVSQSILVNSFVSSLVAIDNKSNSKLIAEGLQLHCFLRDTLISKILTMRKLDHEYGLALLLELSAEEGKKKIVESRVHTLSSYSKVKAFCKLAIDFGHLVSIPDIVKTSKFYYTAADWGKKLSQYQISFTQAFRGGPADKKQVLFKIFENEEIELNLLCEYCRDFGFDIQTALFGSIKILLTSWSVENYPERLKEVLKKLTDQHSAMTLLVHILVNKVFPYDYQKIEVILFMVLSHGYQGDLPLKQGMELLEYLKRYSRVGPMSSLEKEYISKCKERLKIPSVLDDEVLPEEWRQHLPFHQLLLGSSDIVVTLLAAELSKDTLGKLLPICAILKVSLDDILEEAIVKIVENHKSIAATCSSLKFTAVVSLLKKIESPKRALDVAKWLSVELANVDVREAVKPLEVAVNIAGDWKATAKPEDIKEASLLADQFKTFLQYKKTEIVLLDFNITDKEFTSLSGQPTQCVMQLYTKMTPLKNLTVPVHKVVSRIAEIWNLNTFKIRRKLAEQWLPVTSSTNKDMDVTQLSLMEDPTAPQTTGDDDEEEEEQICLRRLTYLMTLPDEVEENSRYLLNWAKSSKVLGGTQSRIRAIQVLFSIATIELIERISEASVTNIQEYIQVILFVSELEGLHIKTTVSAFQSCNKEGLVRTLWKNHSHEPRAMRLICELCLQYDIHDVTLWSKLLEQLINMNMIPYLRYLLKSLVELPLIWKIQNIVPVWYKTLITPLKEVSIPPTTFQINECSKSLKLLQICPFIRDLDIVGLGKAFHSIGMPVHSLACALVLPEEQLQNYIKDVIGPLSETEITSMLIELQGLTGSVTSVQSLQLILLQNVYQ